MIPSRLLRPVTVVALLGSLVSSSGCLLSAEKIFQFKPTPVQITQASADAVDALIQLGEVVEDVRAYAHKLHQSGALPVEMDNAIQHQAIAFSDAKDKAVDDITHAQSALQIAGLAAPLVGEATAIITAIGKVPTVGLKGTAKVVASQLPTLIEQGKNLIKGLGGQV